MCGTQRKVDVSQRTPLLLLCTCRGTRNASCVAQANIANNSGRIVDYAVYKAISQVQVKSPFSNNTCSEAKKNALTQRRRLSSRCCCPIHHSCSRRAKKGSLIAHRSSSRAGLGQDCFSNLAFRCVGHVKLEHGLLIGACGFPWMAAPRGRRLFDTYFSCLHNSVPLLIGSKQRTAFTSFWSRRGDTQDEKRSGGLILWGSIYTPFGGGGRVSAPPTVHHTRRPCKAQRA